MSYDKANLGLPYRSIREVETCDKCGGEVRYFANCDDAELQVVECVARCTSGEPTQLAPALFNSTPGDATQGQKLN